MALSEVINRNCFNPNKLSALTDISSEISGLIKNKTFLSQSRFTLCSKICQDTMAINEYLIRLLVCLPFLPTLAISNIVWAISGAEK